MGPVKPLDMENDNVLGWIEQFEIYCTLNNVSAEKKVLLFLASIGTEAYIALRESLLPDAPTTQGS